MNRSRTAAFAALSAAAALLATACGSSSGSGSSSPSSSSSSSASSSSAMSGDSSSAMSGSSSSAMSQSGGTGGAGGSIIVGSANFDESVILMYIYADALKAKGVNATTKPKIGSREVYVPAVKDGSIDLIPDYSGALLTYADKSSTAASSADIYAALPKAIGSDLTVLDQSQAQDKDSIAVSKATAAKYNLKSIADLAAHSSSMVLGGAPEFKTRPDGPIGLEKVYGVKFQSFKTLDAGGKLSVTALKNGQVDAADLFTTDPSIPANGFVVLDDPKNLYTAQNVLPLIKTSKVTDTIKTTLNAVSAKLTTDVLTQLDKAEYGGTDAEVVAQTWLKANGLG